MCVCMTNVASAGPVSASSRLNPNYMYLGLLCRRYNGSGVDAGFMYSILHAVTWLELRHYCIFATRLDFAARDL